MRELSLLATFPLGVYLGHRANGQLDRLPSPARLHAALMNAAGQGTTAVAEADGLHLSEESVKALTWLEENPPNGIMEPVHQWVDTSAIRFAYRNVAVTKHRTQQRRISDGVSMAEPVGYRWNDVPEAIADTIEELCADVSCLGEASSIVVIEPGEVTPTIHLDPEGSVFDADGVLMEIPIHGRTVELSEQHRAANPGRKLTISDDKFSKNDWPRSPQPSQRCLTEAFYRRLGSAASSQAPWDRVLLLEVEGDIIEPRDRAEFCLAMHRAVVSAIGAGASGMVTGKYATGAVKPANRMAIQYLPPPQVRHHGIESGVLALMLPSDALTEDLEQLGAGLAAISHVWTRKLGRRRVTFTGVAVRAEEFWEAPQEGSVRMWRPQPVVVSEVRPPRRKESPGGWSLADSGLLSLGFVWRKHLNATGRGMALYSSLREQVAGRGAFIANAQSVGASAANFVHRSQPNVTAQIWTGTFHLGDLAADRTLVVIGQSRHLGGGLLAPVDVPTAVFEALKNESRNNG